MPHGIRCLGGRCGKLELDSAALWNQVVITYSLQRNSFTSGYFFELMPLENFQKEILRLVIEAEQMLRSPQEGKPEDATKSRLLEPLLNALGYTPQYLSLIHI